MATHHSIPIALTVAAGLRWRSGIAAAMSRLPRISRDDLLPSRHWPEPELLLEPEQDEGPVLITVEYHIPDANAARFPGADPPLFNAALRNGAYRWGVFRDAADPQRYLETFVVESWGEHSASTSG